MADSSAPPAVVSNSDPAVDTNTRPPSIPKRKAALAARKYLAADTNLKTVRKTKSKKDKRRHANGCEYPFYDKYDEKAAINCDTISQLLCETNYDLSFCKQKRAVCLGLQRPSFALYKKSSTTRW
jgi:hypothetical protein